MSHDPTEIYRADSTQQAYLLKDFLESNGVKASVVNDAAKIADYPPGWSSLPRVMVPSEEEAKARRLVGEFEQELRHEANHVEDATETEADQWQNWPVCPQCGQKRQVLCSICGTAGTDFPLMDLTRTQGEEQVLLFCKTCDDHFRPTFYRRCHACGHDFGDGIRVGREEGMERDPIPGRVWIVAGGMAVLLAALVGYFAWVLWGR